LTCESFIPYLHYIEHNGDDSPKARFVMLRGCKK